ncbi:7-carboxy-7-deazaguanine synthase QueE [Akkermansiaceae bacterium]|nr:7-carboxy-7-deazaguanine synthase QueE [Akkermansiaceae bacterium]MDB4562850.1 7-carboxy-7-deazaguanine synthase QueE [Akkermansiaceae bacterium]
MLISEIFFSIQGEGELTGVPSVFIRTSGCNLRCRWCDTKYASWDPTGTNMSIEDIVTEVNQHGAEHVVVTGGEPMIAKGMPDLLAQLKSHGHHITIETAGTVLPEGITCDLASISPKLSNSSPLPGEISDAWIERHDATRINLDALNSWADNYAFQFKFVVATTQDVTELTDLIGQLAKKIPPSKILLMPEGIDSITIRGRNETLIDLCKQFGYRYCNRLHIELFGNTPGT